MGGSTNRRLLNVSGQFDYNHTFGNVHNLSATLLGSVWQRTTAGSYHRTASANLGLLASYNYAHRYMQNSVWQLFTQQNLLRDIVVLFLPLHIGMEYRQGKFLKDSSGRTI